MSYKRITRSKDEITYRDPMYIRLQELEDKIENNELVDVKENHLIRISRASGKTSLNTVEILTKYENGLLKELSEDSVVLTREEYNELLARPLETMGDLVISKIKEEKCKYFKEIDYGYRKSKQCYAQKCAPEVNCNGCKRNCEKYPKIGVGNER